MSWASLAFTRVCLIPQDGQLSHNPDFVGNYSFNYCALNTSLSQCYKASQGNDYTLQRFWVPSLIAWKTPSLPLVIISSTNSIALVFILCPPEVNCLMLYQMVEQHGLAKKPVAVACSLFSCIAFLPHCPWSHAC